MTELMNSEKIIGMAKALYREEREIKRLDGWFIAKETEMQKAGLYEGEDDEVKKAHLLCEVAKAIPLTISENAIIVGSQRDAFARSYALINPSFTVEGFSGYCDPMAIYGDIEPNGEFTEQRIKTVKDYTAKTKMVKLLNETYSAAENYTGEVLFFTEQVTGHVIPDFRAALKYGIRKLMEEAESKEGEFYRAARISLDAAVILMDRYIALIDEKLSSGNDERLLAIKKNLLKLRRDGADNLIEAIQLYVILWEVMCLEQAPNPYAFSVGNADRIFEPYRKDLTREEAKALFCHFLVFYNVGDRSWAISQNVIVGGRDKDGKDLSSVMTYAIMDAYYEMNLPQPILSVKLHRNTPVEFYREMGRFFFTPGALTPSMFNDDSLFDLLSSHRVDVDDIADCSIAGCQEPLIMGKDNANTTNSWLSLPKVLEALLLGGKSAITGKELTAQRPYTLSTVREDFYAMLDFILDEMVKTANGCSVALSELKVPFLSCFMGGLEYGADMRDTEKQGTKYNGSGCLVHGLTVLADSFIAIDEFNKKYPEDKELLTKALKANFVGYEELRDFLKKCPKFGNNIERVDLEARDIAIRVSKMIRSKKNYLGNSFRPDFSSPSTHLTYGYWVGATPDGRGARDMLGYGVDPLYGEASLGLGFRILSNMKLPFEEFNGGYASHIGVDPKYFKGENYEEKGEEFYNNVVKPLFFNECKEGVDPFYLYVNVTTAETLRKVLADPKKYAPSGVYIMRIHGTFVNFLDLSPEIQKDIITRLDPSSSALGC